MLATPVLARKEASDGPRPIDFRRDTQQVLSLLDLTFGPLANLQGRQLSGTRVSLGYQSPVSSRLLSFSGNLIPGFVWQSSNRIVGNVTLIQSPTVDEYLMANVAVHPDFRRQGIATELVLLGINHLKKISGKRVRLQVDADNDAALRLYKSLGFLSLGTHNQWQSSTSRVRPVSNSEQTTLSLRPLRGSQWQAAHDLDLRSLKAELNWPAPPQADFYKTGLWRQITDFLDGKKIQTWVIEDPTGRTNRDRLIALSAIISDWGRPHQVRVRIDPSWHGQIESSLFAGLTRLLKKTRHGNIQIDYPVEREIVGHLLTTANFQIRRTLTIMSKELSGE